MRPALVCLITAGLIGCTPKPPPPPPAPAPIAEEPVPDAQYCAKPAEKEAVEVAGLKSRLMVAALSCNVAPKYNTFITGHRPSLTAEEKVLAQYFNRNYGAKRGQTEMDQYITALANSQSQKRRREATNFCPDADEIFTLALSAKTQQDLADLARKKPTSQPMNVVECK